MRRFSAVLAVLLLGALPAAAAAKVRNAPAGDAFYTPPSALLSGPHGSLIWARKLSGEAALKSAGRNWKVLYRSVGTNGKPIAVSGTVSLPKGKAPKNGWPVISWDHGTTGIADVCAPSKDSTGNPAHIYISYIYPLLNRWLKAGYAVERTDYQGLGTPGIHQYLVGIAEGRSTLDIIRAAHKLDSRLSERAAIAGHSQGGHAALWGAALAPKWTPDVKLRGTVAFAPASHISEQTSLIRSATSPGGGLSAEAALVLRGLDDFKPGLGLQSLLTDKFAALYPETLSKCQPQLAQPDSIGGVAPSELFRDDADLSPGIAALDQSDPENLKIKTPIAVEQGSADATVLPGLTDDLVKQLRGRGAKIAYKKYANTSHGGVVVAAADHSTKYIKQHLR